MKTRLVKKFFNMVEVALALLVISLGLSTVLTLFPAGLKATAEATNDTNVIEAAERIYAELQVRGVTPRSRPASPKVISSGKDVFGDSGDGGYVYRKIFSGQSAGNVVEFSCAAYVLNPQDGIGFDSASTDLSGKIVAMPAFNDTPDVTAGNSSFKFFSSSDIASAASDKPLAAIKICDVELSYPASVEYEKREKRTFRMVFFDRDFKPYGP